MSTPRDASRRSFLASATALGAVGLGASLGAAVAKKPGAGDELRVGCMNLVTYSHLGIWAPLIRPFTGMRITHCWDIEPEKAKGFANSHGCTSVKNFDDMLGKVDCIISGGYYNHPWNHIIHAPYLEAGLPNLINRPFANSVAKADKMVEMARKHGATILCPSAFEHSNAIARAKEWATGKKILCYNATDSTDDYPTHGIHGVYMACRAIAEAGNPVVSVSYRTKEWFHAPGVVTYEHRDQDGRAFFGTLHLAHVGLGTVHIHTDGEYGGKGFEIEAGAGYPYNKTELWAPTLWAYEAMARGGDVPQTTEQILHKHKVFMAGWWSVLEKDGQPVRLEEVPGDWEAPVELPTRPQDRVAALFRKKFG